VDFFNFKGLDVARAATRGGSWLRAAVRNGRCHQEEYLEVATSAAVIGVEVVARAAVMVAISQAVIKVDITVAPLDEGVDDVAVDAGLLPTRTAKPTCHANRGTVTVGRHISRWISAQPWVMKATTLWKKSSVMVHLDVC